MNFRIHCSARDFIPQHTCLPSGGYAQGRRKSLERLQLRGRGQIQPNLKQSWYKKDGQSFFAKPHPCICKKEETGCTSTVLQVGREIAGCSFQEAAPLPAQLPTLNLGMRPLPPRRPIKPTGSLNHRSGATTIINPPRNLTRPRTSFAICTWLPPPPQHQRQC